MTVRRWRRPSALLILCLLAALVAGCSSAATPAPSAGASTAASAAASAAPSPSPAGSSSAAPSGGAASSRPSIAIPSLPSDDKELEALLPDELCGKPVIKLSLNGESFMDGAESFFTATLKQLGKSASDLAVATAAAAPGTPPICFTVAGVWRVKGADPGKMRDVFLAEAAKAAKGGDAFEQRTVGGKSVYVGQPAVLDDQQMYGYFVGDALFYVFSDSEDNAAKAIEELP